MPGPTTESPLAEKPRDLILLIGFLLALFVGAALAHRDFVECAPLRFHPNVGVAGKPKGGSY